MDRDTFQVKAKEIQFVATALIAGLVVLIGAIVFLRSQGMETSPRVANLGFSLWPIPLALLPVVLVLASVIDLRIAAGGVKLLIQKRRGGALTQPAESATSSVDRNGMGIVAGRFMLKTALVKGVGIIGSAVYILEGNDLALIVPVASVLWMAFLFPTTDRILSEYESITQQVAVGLES
jgi:hypothetical protein